MSNFIEALFIVICMIFLAVVLTGSSSNTTITSNTSTNVMK